MDILWDEAKAKRLKETRGIPFEEVARLILEKRYLAILENAPRPEQMIFIIPHKGYTYVVPCVVDEKDNIVLKTVFSRRRFHRLYGGKKP